MDFGLFTVMSGLEFGGFRGVEVAVGVSKTSDLSRTVKLAGEFGTFDLSRTVKLAGVLGTGLISC